MNALKKRARTSRVLVVGAVAAMGLAACVPPPEEPAPITQIDFESPSNSDVMIFIEGDEETPGIEVTPQLTGTATGSWSTTGTGALEAELTYDDGSFVVDASGTVVTITYKATQSGPTVGQFDPATGAGSLSTSVDLNITNIDLLGEVEQPCSVAIDLELDGQIDPETGLLEVSQDGFSVTPPAEADCSGLGGIMGQLLGGPINSWDLSFEVGTL
jgi:hypothetical protein